MRQASEQSFWWREHREKGGRIQRELKGEIYDWLHGK